jgi:hypothetical protein
MPLQNRVDPWGNILATPARGTLLGNRGILHNSKKQIIKNYQHQGWVTCKLKFKGRKRKLMSPHNFTELFFLDEATAFAAGHRPCCECRRERYNEFKDYWVKANLKMQPSEVKAAVINKLLHNDRINKGAKATYKAKTRDLPDGTIFSSNNQAYLIFGGTVHLWSFGGYTSQDNTNLPDEVDVLTPKTIVNAFRLGFKPEVHESVFS